MSSRWWTLGVWALAAASAAFWGLRLFVASPPLPPHTQTAGTGAALRGDLSRLLGVDAPPPVAETTPEPAPDARFQLIGVVSPRSPQAAREGLALIAVDGKPPKAFRVGAVVDGQTVLKTVGLRGATLGPRDGAAVVALNLPPPAPAATGALPGLPGMAPAPQPPMMGIPQAGRPAVTLPPGVPAMGAQSRRGLPASQDVGEQHQQPTSVPPQQDGTLTR